MSAFEVNITPSRLKNKKRLEGREPTSVVMAPFSSKAIVTFEDVPVSKTAKRILKIYNPSEDEIEVHVTKFIRAEHNVSIDWTSNLVPAANEIEMEIIWSPSIEIACKETLQLTDNRNFRKDIMVILKSTSNKQFSKNVKRFPTISSNVKTLRLKSPQSKPNLQMQQRRIRKSPSYKTQKTERTSPIQKKQQSQKKQISPLLERNIPDIKLSKVENVPTQDFQPPKSSVRLLKENVSPLTPGNVLDLIDKMQFTPITGTNPSKENVKDLDYLSSLPTPINHTASKSDIDESKMIRQMRPRRLPVALDSSEDELSPMHLRVDSRVCNSINIKIEKENSETNGEPVNNHVLINNKTFDLKLMDKSNLLSDSQESIEQACDRVIFNKTTTMTPALSRPLSMIEEEGAHSPTHFLQKTYEIPTVDEQLKRDIKLVGTPLRKFSESMKDLSLRSPSSKISIQGSMPNLNEMESIRSIEQNRYFNASKPSLTCEKQYSLKPKAICLDDSDASNSSLVSCISHAEFMFNQNEILAQSSRFNLNEIGKKSRKNSPVSVPSTNSRKGTPTKSSRKLLESPVKSVGNKRFRDLGLVDSPGSDSSTLSIPKAIIASVSPPKRAKFESDSFSRSSICTNGSKWPIVQPKKPKLARTLSLVKKPLTPRKIKEEPIVKLYDSDLYMQTYINPDPFAATTTRDPFLASTMYLDEQAVEKHVIAFKKWLNALVSIPADLDPDCNQKIDVGRLFNEVRNKELILAPTKEEQSMNYLTKFRLESLRQEAIRFFMSEEMQVPCSKVAVYVHKNAISIRSDRNLHLDVVMQRYILELLLCFNPLWLRLGLEVVFAEKIHLHSCSDVVGLSTFIVNRLFRDKFLEQRYSRAYTLSDEYAAHIKKFTLQKVLFLLLFLDKAKMKRIIKHNPCLFVKKSPYKEPREILLKFSCELLANIGDITRDLKRLGYVLTHKQNFLDEFDYAFNNLAVDLRDGIRLTRIMEIILLRDDLSKLLRVPAISRLQRVYNVNLSLKALAEANFQLKGDINAADIVDGHREKTLSLLWQIIYKFRSPKFHAAASVIQIWWRHRRLSVCIRRRIRVKIEQRQNNAAIIIQSAFRGFMSRKFTKVYKWERTNAAICIQKYIRSYLAQKRFVRIVRSVIIIQRMYRAMKYGALIRRRFVDLRNRVILIQRWVRTIRFARKLEQAAPIIRSIQNEAKMRYEKAIILQRYFKSFSVRSKFKKVVNAVLDKIKCSKVEYKSAVRIQSFWKMIWLRREFRAKREAACVIQRTWMNYRKMKAARAEYIQLRQLTIKIQTRYRSLILMRKERNNYLKMISVASKIQARFRANKLCFIQKTAFLKVRQSVIFIQRRFRAILLMRKIRFEYQTQRSLIIMCQKRFRAKLCMRKQRAEYENMKLNIIRIQRFYRGHLQMKRDQEKFQKTLRAIITIQRKLRATLLARKVCAEYLRFSYYVIVVQQQYKALRQMRIDREEYLVKRALIINVQRRFRANRKMKEERKQFLTLKNSVIHIQRRFRAYLSMRLDRAKFNGKKLAVLCIQQRFRDYLNMKKVRTEFLTKKSAAITIQRWFRSYKIMKTTKMQYEAYRTKVVCIQRRWRSLQLMRKTKSIYENSRRLIILIQRRFRAKILGKKIMQEYERTKTAIICIQRRFRANRQMKQIRTTYLGKVVVITKIQQRFRSILMMKKQRNPYLQQKQSAIIIQQRFRSILKMRIDRNTYLRIRQCIIKIQRRWKATLLARSQKEEFRRLRNSVILIQRKLRATLTMRKQRTVYQQQIQSTILLQRIYRARLAMLKMRSQYLLIKSLVICIQRKFRANKMMKIERQHFLNLKKATIFVQQKFRGRIQTANEQRKFCQIKRVTLGLQAAARGFLARKRFQEMMTPEIRHLIVQRKAASVIQRYWRGYRVRKRWANVRIRTIRENIKNLKGTTDALNTIRWKVQDSVRILRGRFSASDALNVLSRLERMSRTVPHLLMDHSGFISTFCYGIMAQAIRSEVDKQLIEHCSRIILNLARYNSTTANTFQEGGLVTIAQMLLRWCDKDCEIFNTLCTLIWIFSHCPEKRQKIREFMTTPEAIYVVRETKKLVARKEKMKKNVRKPVLTSRGQQGTVFSGRAMPSFEPDYGVIRNKPYTFVSSVFAFDTILMKLDIDICFY